MPIQINPYNATGLAALASANATNLNLPLHSLDIGAPLAGTAKGLLMAAQQQSLFAHQIAQTQLQNQGKIDVQKLANIPAAQRNQIEQQYYEAQNQIAKGTLANAQLQTQQQGQYQQGELGLTQQERNIQALQAQNTAQYQQSMLGNDAQKIKLQAQQVANQYNNQLFDQYIKMDDRQRTIQGAAAGQYTTLYQLYGGNIPKDVEENYWNGLVKQGIIDPQSATQMQNLPSQVKYSAAVGHVYQSSQASNLINAGVVSPMIGSNNKDVKKELTDTTQAIQSVLGSIDDKIQQLNQNPNLAGGQGFLKGIVGSTENYLTNNNPSPGSYADIGSQQASFEKGMDALKGYMATVFGAKFGARTYSQIASMFPDVSKMSQPEAIKSLQALRGELQNQLNIKSSQLTGSLNPTSTNAPTFNPNAPGNAPSSGLTFNDGTPLDSQALEAYKILKQQDPGASDAKIIQHLSQVKSKLNAK